MTRGFITIATGKIHYYKIAANLLLSYRMFTQAPLPFAIIAEEHNEYTALFDHVILANESTHSFMDKFLLMKLSPFDETIFFDSDSLAYGVLNVYWDFFKDATDFSAIGKNVGLNESGAWYNLDGIGKYAEQIQYKTRVHSGVCFIRKSDSLNKLYSDCVELELNYNKLHFHSYQNSKDEGILGIAMPMNSMKAVYENSSIFAAFPCLVKLKADMLNRTLTYKNNWGAGSDHGVLLHWGTIQTYKPLYRFNVECLMLLCKKSLAQFSTIETFLYKYKIKYIGMKISWWIQESIKFTQRACKKIIKQ